MSLMSHFFMKTFFVQYLQLNRGVWYDNGPSNITLRVRYNTCFRFLPRVKKEIDYIFGDKTMTKTGKITTF